MVVSRIFDDQNPITIGVMGDLMCDVYTTGKVKRVSPEAPVPVLWVSNEEQRPGGAGNVILNLLTLGAQVTAMGRIGSDPAGRHIHKRLFDEGADVRYIITQPDYKTPVKNRFIADAQQMLRVDFETFTPLSTSLEAQLITTMSSYLDTVDILAISDYGKGFLSPALLRHTIRETQARGMTVIVDPKGEDFSRYYGATIIKPNLHEAYAAAQMPQTAPLEEVAAALFERSGAKFLMITRSEAGISVFSNTGERSDFPVRSKEIKDVTGAGDTVLAIAALALGKRLTMSDAMRLANIAAGTVIEKVGCATINLPDLAAKVLELDIQNKIFDQEHLRTLKLALRGESTLLLHLPRLSAVSLDLSRTLRDLEHTHPHSKLVAYIDDTEADGEVASLVSLLPEVDFTVMNCKSLSSLIETLEPKNVLSLEPKKASAL